MVLAVICHRRFHWHLSGGAALPHLAARISQFWAFFFSRGLNGAWLKREQSEQDHGEGRVLIGRQTEVGAAVNAEAVEQLRLVSGHRLRQSQQGLMVGIRCIALAGHLNHSHTLQRCGHFFEQGRRTEALQACLVDHGDNARAVVVRQALNQTKHMGAVHRAQHFSNRLFA